MDMFVAVAISRLGDGHGSCFCCVAALPFQGVSDGYGTCFHGKFRGLAMDVVFRIASSRVSD